ncbi:MarR family transcriptional regulator, partial [uncultured Varibaculum sp.]|uniref:MarR family winged helix-turn-helix transcriptional regulator n=1 Tax=uncultured Varibaculum sp. TaxID=413896 RepID=UPI00338F6457
NILNYMDNTSNPTNERKQLLDQLLYELHRLVFASTDLVNRYSSKLGLHGKDGEALLQIWQAELSGTPLSPSELAEQLHITRAAVSYLTDRLIDLGYVNRETNETDRRKTILRISELGGQIGHGFTAPMEAGLNGLFAARTQKELKTFTEMLQDFVESLDTSHDLEA